MESPAGPTLLGVDIMVVGSILAAVAAMAVLFAIFLLIAYGLAFNGAQSNTIAQGLSQAFSIPNWVTGVSLVIITALVIYGGLKSGARTAEKIVPIMAIGYFLVALYVLVVNIGEVPAMLELIVKSAFGYGPAVGGAVGYTIKIAMENGIMREAKVPIPVDFT